MDNPQEFSDKVFYSAIEQGRIDTVRSLLKQQDSDALNYALIYSSYIKQEKILSLLLSDPRTDKSGKLISGLLEHSTVLDPSIIHILKEPRESKRVITQNSNRFSEGHHMMLHREITLKECDLEYYLEWILKNLNRKRTPEKTKRFFSSVARSILNDESVVHTSSIFTAYRGFFLLGISEDKEFILDTLRQEEGVTPEGLELADTLIEAYLDGGKAR